MVNITSKKQLTLIMTLDKKNEKVLLGMKKRGFGCNKWNGFGGKVEKGETIEEGARRELMEEAMIEADDMTRMAINMFSFENDPVGLEVHIYLTTSYKGTPTETEEMRPEWFAYDDIPFDKMWKDDEQWVPLLLKGQHFIGQFHFSEDQNDILKQHIEHVDHVPAEFDLNNQYV